MVTLNERIFDEIKGHLEAAYDLLMQSVDAQSQPQAAPQEPEDVTVTGRVARPQYSTPRGRPVWTAGIGVQTNGPTKWINAVAFGDLAIAGQKIQRGADISVIGTFTEETYTDRNGIVQTKQTFVINRFA